MLESVVVKGMLALVVLWLMFLCVHAILKHRSEQIKRGNLELLKKLENMQWPRETVRELMARRERTPEEKLINKIKEQWNNPDAKIVTIEIKPPSKNKVLSDLEEARNKLDETLNKLDETVNIIEKGRVNNESGKAMQARVAAENRLAAFREQYHPGMIIIDGGGPRIGKSVLAKMILEDQKAKAEVEELKKENTGWAEFSAEVHKLTADCNQRREERRIKDEKEERIKKAYEQQVAWEEAIKRTVESPAPEKDTKTSI